MNKIHQIFIDIGKGKLSSIGRYVQSHDMTKLYCLENNIEYRLWTKDSLDTLMENFRDGEYLSHYREMRLDIQRIDFAKYVILYCFGGIYMDLDVSIIPGQNIDHLFKLDPLIVCWNDLHLPSNAIMGSKLESPLFLDIIRHSFRDYSIKSKIDIYWKWVGRFVFQTTGHNMLHRALRRNGLVSSDYQDILHVISKGKEVVAPQPIFLDTNESIWYL